jgi:dihydropteroate synthase
MQKRYHWKLKRRELMLGERTLLMGVLNVTPDSFSDGGKFSDPDRAFARAVELEEQGADIVDVGAESTRPGSQRISEGEELRRLIPVLKRLRGKLTTPISVDTYKSGVAEKALEHGAEIINDPTGILLDLQLPKVVAKYDAGLIVNHMRGTPETWAKLPPLKDLMRSIAIDLEAALHRARQSGVQRHQLAIDPGLGFGKRREQNSEIIASLGALRSFDLPVLVGPSRKSFLRKEQADLTEYATAAAVTASILNGAHIVRVHDVRTMKSVAEVADAIKLAVISEADQPAHQARWQRGQ